MSIHRQLVLGGGSVAVLAALGAYLLFRPTYTRDLKTICNGEKAAGATLLANAATVATWVHSHVETDEARKLLEALPNDAVVRSRKLHEEAEKAGIGACPLADSYTALHKQGELRGDLVRLCEEGAFPQIPYQDDAQRLETLKTWGVRSAKTGEIQTFIARLADAPKGERGRRLKQLALDRNVFQCELARELDAPKLPPRPAEVKLQGDPQHSGGAITDIAFRRAFESVQPALSKCYSAGLATDPSLAGSLNLRLAVPKGGGENRVVPVDGSMADKTVRDCVEETLRGMHIDGDVSEGGSLFFGLAFRPPSPV